MSTSTLRNPDLQQRLRTAAVLIGAILLIGILSLYFCFFHWVLFDLAVLAIFICGWEYTTFSGKAGARRIVHTVGLVLPSIVVAYGVTVLGLCDRLGGYSPMTELAVVGFIFSFIGSAIIALRQGVLPVSEIGRSLVSICSRLCLSDSVAPGC